MLVDDPPFVYTHPNGHVYVTDPSVDLMFVKWNQHFGSPVSSVYGVDASHKVREILTSRGVMDLMSARPFFTTARVVRREF